LAPVWRKSAKWLKQTAAKFEKTWCSLMVYVFNRPFAFDFQQIEIIGKIKAV
jgi:hypothetical protein